MVGVVGAVKHRELSDPTNPGAVYFPYRYHASQGVYVVVRTGPAPELFQARLRQCVAEIDPDLPLTQVATMKSRVEDSLLGNRSPTWRAALFSLVALALSATGTYGVLAFSVTQRRGEIGIRMALGALRSQIATQFLGQASRLAGLGLVIGTLIAVGAGETLDRFLFGVPSWHPGLLALAARVVFATGALAALAPSLRAARTDPNLALRSD